VLRWLEPYFLIILFGFNLLLPDHTFYRLALVLQIAFYVLALLGYLWQKKGKHPRTLGIPFSFCLVGLAALVGVTRFVMGKKKSIVGLKGLRNCVSKQHTTKWSWK